MLLDIEKYNSTYYLEVEPERNGVNGQWGYPMRGLWSVDGDPFFIDSYVFSWGQTNIPLFLRLTNCTMDDLALQKLIIRMNDPSDHNTIDRLSFALKDAT